MTLSNKIRKLAYTLTYSAMLGVLAACQAGGQTSATTTTNGVSSTSLTNVATTDSNASTSATTSKTSQIDWATLPTSEVTLTDEGLTISEAGTYVLTGDTTGGVTVNSTGNVRLILAGTTISSKDNAALYVEGAENVVVELQSGTENMISDSSVHSDTSIEGALYSKDDLTITGEGQLTVEGNYQDGIVSNDDLTIQSGNITVTAKDDGIRGKDSLEISGGTIDVTAGGDGLKATNDEDTSKGYTYISGGAITVSAGDDAIKAESSLTIDGGDIKVTDSVEALEGTNVTINGGNLNLYASDDGINASSTVTGSDIFIKITGGDIKLEIGQGDTDAVDANGDIYMSGGTLDITAQSAFDFDGVSDYTGGTIIVNGETQNQIVSNGPGGGGRPSW